ncbi:hypothetical protein [Stutzerimonas stutzeri]|uniref:hypothetical protein n=1 Tax=Stutzerimonas stutzeri TaxID=316 RepID=UPI0002D8817E|nr:hypothetical protein [Stutzerimonas stutzeri]
MVRDSTEAAEAGRRRVNETVSAINNLPARISDTGEHVQGLDVAREAGTMLDTQSATGAHQTAAASEELARLATDLNQLALRFKT